MTDTKMSGRSLWARGLAEPVRVFLRTEAGSAGVLVAAIVVALLWANLAGGSYEIDQQLIFRPAPSMCRYRTPVKGLYMAGASVHPGGAVHGVSGAGAARAFLRDRRIHRA